MGCATSLALPSGLCLCHAHTRDRAARACFVCAETAFFSSYAIARTCSSPTCTILRPRSPSQANVVCLHCHHCRGGALADARCPCHHRRFLFCILFFRCFFFFFFILGFINFFLSH